MMKAIKTILLLGVTVLLASCGSDYPGFRQSRSGLYYQFHIENEGAPMPLEGDVVTVNMVYRDGDSVLFNSSELPGPFSFPLDPPGFDGDIFEGIAMMHLGDSATFIVPADSLKRYGNMPELDSGTMLFFDIRLLKIQSKADFDKEMALLKAEQEEELQRMKEQEQGMIDAYLAENAIRTKADASGLYILSLRNGKGPKAAAGIVVEIHYSASFLSGEKLFSSHDESGASIFFEMGKDFEIPGIEEALHKMNAGSHARVLLPSSLAYGEEGIPGLVPPYSPLLFELELLSLSDPADYKTRMEAREKADIAAYIKKKGITTTPRDGGLYYVETKKGNGSPAVVGKLVSVKYIGSYLNGTIFENSETYGPLEFRIGEGEIIPGLELGVSFMNAGGKALLVVPSSMGYGDTYTGTIPPYTPLVFEVELISVR